MFWNIFIKNLARFKLFFLICLLMVLCSIPPLINAQDINLDSDEPHDYIDYRGHGLGGLRGGIVFSFEDTDGYGYNHDEILNNIRIVFGG